MTKESVESGKHKQTNTAIYAAVCVLILLARLWSILKMSRGTYDAIQEVVWIVGNPGFLAAMGLLVWYVFAVHEAAVGAPIGISCMLELLNRRRRITEL